MRQRLENYVHPCEGATLDIWCHTIKQGASSSRLPVTCIGIVFAKDVKVRIQRDRQGILPLRLKFVTFSSESIHRWVGRLQNLIS